MSDYIDPDAWAAFVAMRSAIKKPLTERGADRILRRLAEMHAAGLDVNEALDQSSDMQWQDVYPPKKLEIARPAQGSYEATQARLKAVLEAGGQNEAGAQVVLAKLDVHLAADVAETTMLVEKEQRAKAAVADLEEQQEDLEDQLELDKEALRAKGEEIGAVLRTRDGVAPVYVSSGHRVSLETACAWVLRLAPRYRLPETTRIADRLVGEALRDGP
jgi:hypothetical protein